MSWWFVILWLAGVLLVSLGFETYLRRTADDPTPTLAETERLAAEYDLPWVRADGSVTTPALREPTRDERTHAALHARRLAAQPEVPRESFTVNGEPMPWLISESGADAAYEALSGRPPHM